MTTPAERLTAALDLGSLDGISIDHHHITDDLAWALARIAALEEIYEDHKDCDPDDDCLVMEDLREVINEREVSE